MKMSDGAKSPMKKFLWLASLGLLASPMTFAKGEKTPAKKEAGNPKVKPTPKKLEKKDVKVGKGPEAQKDSWVKVNYTGMFADGRVFDSSKGGKPFVFQLGQSKVIRGWDEGVPGMKVGGERQLAIPAALAYGERGAPPVIAPNTPIFFDVELLGISDQPIADLGD